MTTRLVLPEDDKSLVKMVKRVVGSAEPYRNRERVRWLLTSLYMQGIREFTNIDWINGAVDVVFHNQLYSDLDFKFEKILQTYQTELGRLMQLDLSPQVKRRGEGLDGLRKASISQILLNDRMPKSKSDAFKLKILPSFLKYGHVGIGAFRGPNGPYSGVIPPWELMSIPANPTDIMDSEGIMRVRWMTPEGLEKEGLEVKGNEADLELQTAPRGQTPVGEMAFSLPGLHKAQPMPSTSNTVKEDKNEDKQQWTKLVEIWVRSQDNILEQYGAVAGKMVLKKNTIAPVDKIPCPMNIVRYLDVGGFYGRGFVDQFIPLNNEAEYMLNQLFKNVEDFDQFGFLCLSTQMGLSLEDVMTARSGSKVLFYNTDIYNEKAQPFNIQPANTGMMPTKIVEICLGLMQTQSQQSELFSGDAPGRVDNAKALSLLYETANIPLSGPTESLSAALSGAYKSLLWLTRDEWDNNEPVALTLSDDALVGVVYDKISGEVTIDRESIHSPHEVVISVGSKMHMSEAQLRADLQESLESGIITPREYRIKVREAGLRIPVGNEVEWQSYRRAKMENVVLYGDGIKPGKIITSVNDLHEVHLEVLQAFMARPEYHLAEQGVRDKFEAHRDFHTQALGEFPEGMPYPGTEDEILQQQQAALEGQEAGPVRLS